MCIYQNCPSFFLGMGVLGMGADLFHNTVPLSWCLWPFLINCSPCKLKVVCLQPDIGRGLNLARSYYCYTSYSVHTAGTSCGISCKSLLLEYYRAGGKTQQLILTTESFSGFQQVLTYIVLTYFEQMPNKFCSLKLHMPTTFHSVVVFKHNFAGFSASGFL